MDGCGCDDYATPIDTRVARADRERYRSRGPDRTTQMLLDLIAGHRGDVATILDVGGGIGVIVHELLKSGVAKAVLVEASPAYLEVAHDEARAAHLLDRLDIVAGDFVCHAQDIQVADLVTLDRVVCCYPDADALVSVSAARARKLFGLVLPRDRWFVRWALRMENLRWQLRRRAYRAYAHANGRIDELAAAGGLRPIAESFTTLWRVVLYQRDDLPQAGSMAGQGPVQGP